MLSRLRRMVRTALRGDGLLPVDGVRQQTIAAAVAADPEGWAAAVKRAKGGRKVLIATTVTGFAHVNTVESVLAAALTMRGAEVHLLVCDAVLPGCLRAEQDNVPDWRLLGEYKLADVICASCMANGRKTFGSLGLSIHRLSELLTDEERIEARRVAAATPLDRVRSVTLEHTAVGEHAYAGCLRYFARGSIEGIEGAKTVSQRYLEAAILTMRAVSRLLDRIGNVSTAVFHHGIYVPQGLTGEVCRQRGIPVVNWNPSYRKNTFIFSHGDTYHHTLIDEPTAMWESVRWSEAEERKILDYLASRVTGTRDWIWFHEKPDQDFEGFAKKVGLNLQKPTIGMLTNVMWDAQLHYPANAFAGMLEWTIETIRYFEKRPDLQLLLRVHPAEIRGTAPSRQPIIAEIAKVFPTVPANVYIIRPESPVSTYAAMAHCDSVLIYGTKTGVELTAIGTPVIVGGEAWIRHKGLTRDARSPEEYFRFLDSLPLGQRMPEEQVVRARKYAYHFFFRRMIPLPFIEPLSGKIYDLNISSLESLDRTHYPGLDVICDGILEGSPFIYNAEIYGLHDEVSG
jgi:capsular polysaccharide biosynthesis protein